MKVGCNLGTSAINPKRDSQAGSHKKRSSRRQ